LDSHQIDEQPGDRHCLDMSQQPKLIEQHHDQIKNQLDLQRPIDAIHIGNSHKPLNHA
jgi:hypothetical protein